MLAGVIRLAGLAVPDGQMDTDEARLALAADGVLRSGLPVMPTGRIYTRGVLNSYLIATSFALFGRSDFAARLPSVVAGALLVPVVFLLGLRLGGAAAGMATASFVTLAEPLAESSRSAWFPSLFLLLFTSSAYCCLRGFVERRGAWQVAGAGLFCLAVLTYEFALLLPAGLGLYITLRAARGDWGWHRGRATWWALGLMLGGLALLASLALALRAGTLAGPLGEVQTYVSPKPELDGLGFYLDLFSDYYVLIVVALLGAPLLARSRPRGLTYLGALLALSLLVPSFVIQVKTQPRYALSMLPLLAVVAAAATLRLIDFTGRLAPAVRRGEGYRSKGAVSAGSAKRGRSGWRVPALLVVFGLALHRDVPVAAHHLQPSTTGVTWLEVLQQQGLQPTDLLVAEAPTIVHFYLGRDEFYVHPDDNERYVYQAPGALRSIYTDSALVSERGDFERLVERPYAGRSVWMVSRRGRLQQLMNRIDPSLWPSLVRSADQVLETRDGWVLVKVTLPRRPG
jgi:4-amino-4-deoxy-L-arabinose transferase-like glycosyltransferase